MSAEHAARRLRRLGASGTTLSISGQVAIVLAAAGVVAHALRASGAPSWAFVVQCLALGLAALGARSLPQLRNALPALSTLTTACLALVVVLEVLRSGRTVLPLEIAGSAAVLPLLAIQIADMRRRALALCLAATAVVAAAVVAGMPVAFLVPLATTLAFTVGVGLLATMGLDATGTQRERRNAARRRSMMRERQRMRAREELVANLSHDLRNPLAIALGFSEMAEDEDLPPEERAQALSGLRRSLWEMSQLVENVLDGSADDAGALTSSIEPVDLERLCAEVVSATRVLLRRRPVTLSGEVEPGLVVLADRQRLLRVLGNLLGNACKYTASGEIRLDAMVCERFAVLRVTDTGPGIPPDAMPYIFDRFRRAHRGGPAGVGLGLAIAQRLTERMGGRLEVSSEVGVGSTFIVTLPLAAAERSQSFAA